MSVCRKSIRQQISDLQQRLNVYKKKKGATIKKIEYLLDKISDSYLNNNVGKFFELHDGAIYYVHSKCNDMNGEETLVKTIEVRSGGVWIDKRNHQYLYRDLRDAKEISRKKFIRLAEERTLDLLDFNNI